nr:P-type conjugative transfer protein TrbJ [Sphingomonas sp. Y57]
MNRRRLIIAALASAATATTVLAVVAVPDNPATAAMPVFDSGNYAQNILTAARTLQQVDQQIRQLQNEAEMLGNMGKNLSRIDFPQLEALKQKLAGIDRLMGQAQGLDFRVDQLDARFARLFPREFAAALRGDQRVLDARARLDASYDAFRQTMAVQNRVVENVRDDAETLAAIVERSQGAEGALQVGQATNQLLALTAKQQFQVQQLMAAQFRSDAIERARRATQATEARAATKKFLGSGSAYPPPE